MNAYPILIEYHGSHFARDPLQIIQVVVVERIGRHEPVSWGDTRSIMVGDVPFWRLQIRTLRCILATLDLLEGIKVH